MSEFSDWEAEAFYQLSQNVQQAINFILEGRRLDVNPVVIPEFKRIPLLDRLKAADWLENQPEDPKLETESI